MGREYIFDGVDALQVLLPGEPDFVVTRKSVLKIAGADYLVEEKMNQGDNTHRTTVMCEVSGKEQNRHDRIYIRGRCVPFEKADELRKRLAEEGFRGEIDVNDNERELEEGCF